MKQKKRAYACSAGTPLRLGAYRRPKGVNFSINVRGNEHVEVLLYEPGATEPFQVIDMSDDYKTGLVDAVYVEIPPEDVVEYNYRIDGVVTPDPCARIVRTATGADGKEELRCGIEQGYVNETEPLVLRYRDNVFYKLHVRGFTAGEGSGVRHPGTFLGVQEKIPYLQKLGVNAVILMPVYEFTERPARMFEGPAYLAEEQRANYWGYTDGLYYVPKQRYCATEDAIGDFGAIVAALHENGIE